MSPLPSQLALLLAARNDLERESAWQRFVDEYTRLLLHVARSTTSSHDEAMDAYAYVLGALRECEYQRLRKYALDPRSKFTTWLVVVTRRLCFDHNRARVGRVRPGETEEAASERSLRRRLIALAGDDVDTDALPGTEDATPEDLLLRGELHDAVEWSIGQLPPPDQLLVKLRFRDGCSAAEIARLMHYPSPFHVYRRLSAVTDQLRSMLARRGVESATH